MGALPSSFPGERGRHWELETFSLGQASFPWGKTTPLPQHLINCSPCSALLSMRECLAWVQTHLINFTVPLGTSPISLP